MNSSFMRLHSLVERAAIALCNGWVRSLCSVSFLGDEGGCRLGGLDEPFRVARPTRTFSA